MKEEDARTFAHEEVKGARIRAHARQMQRRRLYISGGLMRRNYVRTSAVLISREELRETEVISESRVFFYFERIEIRIWDLRDVQCPFSRLPITPPCPLLLPSAMFK